MVLGFFGGFGFGFGFGMVGFGFEVAGFGFEFSKPKPVTSKLSASMLKIKFNHLIVKFQ